MRLGRAILTLLLLVASLGAGCIGGSDDDATRPASAGEPAGTNETAEAALDAANGTVENATKPGVEPEVVAEMIHRGCDQYHLFYVVDWASVEPIVPEGFSPDGSDPTGTTTTLYQHLSACELEAATGNDSMVELWTGVVVTPPSEFVSDDAGAVIHLVLMDVVVQSDELAGMYDAWGFDHLTRDGSFSWSDTGTPAARVGSVEVNTEGATYELEAQVGPPTVGNVSGSGRVFAVDNRTVTGWFDYSWPGWTDLGLGTVVFRSMGDNEAPFAFPGQIHQVADTDVTLVYEAYAP